jgi:histidyl-tRNA synthetase
MYDLLPDDIRQWHHIEATAREQFHSHGYAEIRTPLMEETQLFARGIGESTDIVIKEMYTFTDRKGRSLTLRPEGTASIVRAYIEHKLHARQSFSKLYYIGPMFRYERPQAGRNRQFYQIGAEAIGSASPLVDFEIMELAFSFFRKLGLKELSLLVNSLGCSADREKFAEALRRYFDDKLPMLCPDCRKRLDRNPLRVLDCKVENCKKLAAGAPTTEQHLCEGCRGHFDVLCSLLKSAGIDYVFDPRLVRGLDYYTGAVFEIHHTALGARSAICGGGRYDRLVEEIGGPPIPATGFSLGVEAAILAMKKEKAQAPPASAPDAFLCPIGESAAIEAALIAFRLRNEGLYVEMDYEGRSLKAQMKQANKANAKCAVIIGDEELARKSARVREMSTGNESLVPMDELPSKLTSTSA